MKPENLIKESCNLSFNRPYKGSKGTNDLADILDEVNKLLPEDIFINLDNLIGLCNARNLEDGYSQGFKDGSNLIMYLISNVTNQNTNE